MDLLVVFLAGFAASFVDGALGMGFGPTSSSILLGGGLSPAAVSTTVNLAKVATGVSSAIAHRRFDNVHKGIVRRLAISGSIGALIGVTVLANVDGDALQPLLAGLLLLVAVRILWRYSRMASGSANAVEVDEKRFLGPATSAAGAVGGVTNGLVGAWGPVVTPFLLHRGVAPRYAIGSANTAEVAVAIVASGSLLASLGGGGIDIGIVLAMLAGGVLAAPFAAWSIRHLPSRGLGIAVAGLLFLTNIRLLAAEVNVGAGRWIAYVIVVATCLALGLRVRSQSSGPRGLVDSDVSPGDDDAIGVGTTPTAP